MGSFETRGSKFIYIDDKGSTVLLDLDDFMSNYGRIPFHSDITDITVPNLILKNMDRHGGFCAGNQKHESLLAYYTMLDVMFVREHTRSKYPKKIYIIGGNGDVLISHLSFLAGYFHPESEVRKITETDLTEIEPEYADMVFLDLTEDIVSDNEIAEAYRILKSGGAAFLINCGHNEIDETFGIRFEDVEKYDLDSNAELLRGHKVQMMDGLPRGSNVNEIAFIVCTNNKTYLGECKKYISELYVPEGIQVTFHAIEDSVSMTSGYNEAMKASNARYKVYLHQDVFIVNRNFISDVIKCFEQDDKLGILGVAGAKKVPSNAYVCTALDLGTCYSVGAFEGLGVIAVKPEYNNPKGLYGEAEYIDGMLMVTSYDIPWNERIEGFHFYDLSQCMNYHKQGLKTAVARQDEIWTFHDFGPLDLETYDRNREKFCEEYNSFTYDGGAEDEGNIYTSCKKLAKQLTSLFDSGKYNEVADILRDLDDVRYFNQDILTMAFIMEIGALEEKAYGSTDYRSLKENYLKLRLRLIETYFDRYSMDQLVDSIQRGEASFECIKVAVLHNVPEPETFLTVLSDKLAKCDIRKDSDMGTDKHFDVLIVVTPADCERLLPLYPQLVKNFDYGKLKFIGAPKVGELAMGSSAIAGHVSWMDENDIVSFDEVHACMTERLRPIMGNETVPRGVTGWYYQQFLKMQYSALCQDEYYMVWDGDTVPCRKINMFSPETGQPYLDLKHEYHTEYFDTMGKILPGFRKVIERSFISEHMLFKTDIMRSLISEIEKNDNIPGEKFWEKIINAIEPEKIQDSSFSEFETYGTYVALRCPEVYKLREWHSFRMGGSFFDMNTICERDFNWLGVDFDSISFEKGQTVAEGNGGYFDNPEVQQKISAKKLLQAAQMEYKDGYKEVWEDDITVSNGANVRTGGYQTSQGDDNRTLIVIVSYNSCHLMEKNLESIRQVLTPGTYKIVVVDNASNDGVEKYLAGQQDITFIRNEENVGFGPACNQAVKATCGTEFENYDVFLLNNDTRLVFDSLYFLRKALYSADDIGAVGSVSNYAGNKQQLDVTFDKVEDYIAFGEKNNVPMESPCLERVRLSGFAMLIRRKVWDEIGGFDEDFAPGYFEDDALSMEILKKGYRLQLVRNSFIYHAGSQSFIKTDYKKLLEDHHELFKQKYGFDILDYAYASGTVISQIPYGPGDRFTLLHYGAGLGAELKAIRSLFPNADLYGIETNLKLHAITRKTEKVFASPEEMLEFINTPFFNVMIVEKDDLKEMDESLQTLLSGLLLPDASVLVKDRKYETFPYEKIKLIIWDMDDTFWQGILSEGEVILPITNADLIKSITDHGVVNSISSKNDEEPVMEELARAGIAEHFVFNNINWEEKGAQIAAKISAMGLRAENVLFIDDNPRNLEEAKYSAEGLMTAEPDIIPYLTTFFARTRATDTDHKRLAQYKILEKKTQAQVNSTSKADFLKESDIRIVINRNCLEKLDRLHELVMRSNQLNFTKNRDNKEILTRLITNDWNDCGYIEARDRFGDYGIIGFFCYNTREKKMEHFLFSCRVLGMGIEQYIYNKLGCPDFEVKDPVSVKLEKGKAIDYITEEENLEVKEDTAAKGKVRILLKGPCDLDSIEPYLAGASITSEFNYINDQGFVTTAQNHSMHIWESANLSKEAISRITAEVPFITEGDFLTKLFDEKYHVICFSMMTDLVQALYKRKDSEEYIAFSNRNQILTDPANKEGFISGKLQGHGFPFTEEIIDEFSKNWECVGTTPLDLLFRNLDYIYDNVKGKPLFILLLGSEIDYEGSSPEFDGLGEVYRQFNPILEEFAADHERMKVINITNFINSQEDYFDSINHFSRNVYYKIAGEIARYINEFV